MYKVIIFTHHHQKQLWANEQCENVERMTEIFSWYRIFGLFSDIWILKLYSGRYRNLYILTRLGFSLDLLSSLFLSSLRSCTTFFILVPRFTILRDLRRYFASGSCRCRQSSGWTLLALIILHFTDEKNLCFFYGRYNHQRENCVKTPSPINSSSQYKILEIEINNFCRKTQIRYYSFQRFSRKVQNFYSSIIDLKTNTICVIH